MNKIISKSKNGNTMKSKLIFEVFDKRFRISRISDLISVSKNIISFPKELSLKSMYVKIFKTSDKKYIGFKFGNEGYSLNKRLKYRDIISKHSFLSFIPINNYIIKKQDDIYYISLEGEKDE